MRQIDGLSKRREVIVMVDFNYPQYLLGDETANDSPFRKVPTFLADTFFIQDKRHLRRLAFLDLIFFQYFVKEVKVVRTLRENVHIMLKVKV